MFYSYCFMIFLFLIRTSTTNPISTTESQNIQTQEKELLQIIRPNKTIDQLVQQQTDVVKKIVADYPIITKHDPHIKESNKEINLKDIDKLSLEELKIRCQHLSKLLENKTENNHKNLVKSDRIDTASSQYSIRRTNINKFYSKQPTYVTPKTTTNIPKGGHYITTPYNSVKPIGLPNNVKYIRLEPVILQKTMLSDGRIVYYWHKSLPTAVQYGNPSKEFENSASAEFKEQSTQKSESTTPSASTTTASSYSYDFRNLFPFYGYRSDPETSTLSTTTSTTTTTTTPKPTEPVYTQQLKFVVPVPVGSGPGETVQHNPWAFDQYAYYPKELQPSMMQVQIPYTPTFHVIKTLTVPNKDSIDNIEFKS